MSPYLMHELSFNHTAFDAFQRIGYLGKDGTLVHDEYDIRCAAEVGAAF